MLHARPVVFALATLVALGGCSTTYRETLEQRLQGRTTDEKRVILAQECGQQIKAGEKPEDPANMRHFEKMRQICEEMTGQKVKANLPAGS